MKTYEEVEELIKKYDKGDAFTGRVSDDKIKNAEEELGIKFPEQYKWFLRKYGHGGVLGIDTLGVIEKTNSFPVVRYTKQCRGSNLKKEYIVIEDIDEYYYCLSVEDGKVRDWDFRGETYYEIESFLDYIYTRIKDATDEEKIYMSQWKIKK